MQTDTKIRLSVRFVAPCPNNLDDLFILLAEQKLDKRNVTTYIVGKGGSSSSNAHTIFNDAEWSATGIAHSLADKASSGKRDVYVSFVRAVSRITEMASWE
jgi:hypothetical protein